MFLQCSYRFTGNTPGPKREACGVTTAMECFLLFITSALLDILLTQSNLYANQQRTAKNNCSPWTPIGHTEFMAFIGMNIAMGIIPLPSLDEYWSTDPIMAHAWFPTVMSRNRFRQIL